MTAAETLDMLDGVLSKRDQTAQQVWGVLAALRGPDDQNVVRKRTSTARVRARAFPRAASAVTPRGGDEVRVPVLEVVNTDGQPIEPGTVDDHFGWHAEKARRALAAMGR